MRYYQYILQPLAHLQWIYDKVCRTLGVASHKQQLPGEAIFYTDRQGHLQPVGGNIHQTGDSQHTNEPDPESLHMLYQLELVQSHLTRVYHLNLPRQVVELALLEARLFLLQSLPIGLLLLQRSRAS